MRVFKCLSPSSLHDMKFQARNLTSHSESELGMYAERRLLTQTRTRTYNHSRKECRCGHWNYVAVIIPIHKYYKCLLENVAVNQFFHVCLDLFLFQLLGTNSLNCADLPLSNKQTNKQHFSHYLVFMPDACFARYRKQHCPTPPKHDGKRQNYVYISSDSSRCNPPARVTRRYLMAVSLCSVMETKSI